MAVAKTRTILPLDDFFRIMGGNPLHGNMVEYAGQAITCASVVTQYSWQGADKVGREELAECIADAEAAIAQELGYAPGPTWTTGYYQQLMKPQNPEAISWDNTGPSGMLQGIQLPVGMFLTPGLETWTPLVDDAGIVYTSVYAPFEDTATITFNVGAGNPQGISASEIAITYPGQGPADSGSSSYAGPGYEIRPTQVALNSVTGTCVVTVSSLGLLQWAILNGVVDVRAIQLLDAPDPMTSFLATVDVYRHWTDPSQQVQWQWERPGFGSYGSWIQPCWCSGSVTSPCPACVYEAASGCLRHRDRRLGIVTGQAGTWDSTTTPAQFDSAAWNQCRPPDAMVANWQHGLVDGATGLMRDDWKRAVAYLAASRLDRPMCDCNQMENFSRYWSDDKALVTTNQQMSQSYKVSDIDLNNPLGTTRAAIYVWRMIQRQRIGQGLAVAY